MVPAEQAEVVVAGPAAVRVIDGVVGVAAAGWAGAAGCSAGGVAGGNPRSQPCAREASGIVGFARWARLGPSRSSADHAGTDAAAGLGRLARPPSPDTRPMRVAFWQRPVVNAQFSAIAGRNTLAFAVARARPSRSPLPLPLPLTLPSARAGAGRHGLSGEHPSCRGTARCRRRGRGTATAPVAAAQPFRWRSEPLRPSHRRYVCPLRRRRSRSGVRRRPSPGRIRPVSRARRLRR